MTITPLKLGSLMATSALLGALGIGALSGFQANTAPKFGMVDIGKVFDGSSLAAANNETLQNARKARFDTLTFIGQNVVMDPKDAKRYADLATNSKALTPSEKTEMDRLRTTGETATRTRTDLSTKATTSDDEKKALANYGNNAQANRIMLQDMQGAFEADLQNMRDDLREKTLDRVQEQVRKIGAQKGFTVVFTSATAPYAATDITKECADAMKK